MDDELRQHCLAPAAVTTNKDNKASSFKSSESILKKEGGPDRHVSNNKFSYVTLYKLATKARERYCSFNTGIFYKDIQF